MAVIATTGDLARLTAAPPNVPSGRLHVLRDAYRKAVSDPQLIKDGKKILLDIDPAFGEDVRKMVVDAAKQPTENIALLKKIITLE
ncbi:MAG: hypothetical protein V1753_12575 [Pseudomonadota bacterium]